MTSSNYSPPVGAITSSVTTRIWQHWDLIQVAQVFQLLQEGTAILAIARKLPVSPSNGLKSIKVPRDRQLL